MFMFGVRFVDHQDLQLFEAAFNLTLVFFDGIDVGLHSLETAFAVTIDVVVSNQLGDHVDATPIGGDVDAQVRPVRPSPGSRGPGVARHAQRGQQTRDLAAQHEPSVVEADEFGDVIAGADAFGGPSTSTSTGFVGSTPFVV